MAPDLYGPRLRYNQIGRNDPCPCGSGKKYKHCCGNKTKYLKCLKIVTLCMMEVQIKITKEQNEMLLERLGSEEAIREWMQATINERLYKKAEELRSKNTTLDRL